MKLGPDSYVPSLRWRMGESQALWRLSSTAKDRVVPFIVIPEIEFDFEAWAPKKNVHEHVHPFPARYNKKWGMREAWVDVHPKIHALKMDDGRLPIAYIFDELRVLGSTAIPVTSMDGTPAINAAVNNIVKADGRGLGIRARIEHVMKPGCKASIEALMVGAGVEKDETDLIIDLGAPAYDPYDDFADGLMAAMAALGDLSKYRSYVVMGCSYPETIGLDKPGGDITRHDWLFYKALVAKMAFEGVRIPNYGDYTIVNPEFTPRDMRLIKSGGKVVYTEAESWHIRKGGAFRDNPQQMHGHCQYLITSGKFRGSGFSDGDAFIEKVAKKTGGPSNQPFWKQVAINHHIMHVLEDLSKFGGAA